jgi:tetratricopeptide (TPR) repeat protein
MRRSAAAAPASHRLLELDQKGKKWNGMKEAARHQIAINPVTKPAQFAQGCAAQATGDEELASGAFEKLLLLKPENPAEIHFRLGQIFSGSDPEKARRHVIEALVEAPRYGEAHDLLAELRAKLNKS